jgi:hypothetical protein
MIEKVRLSLWDIFTFFLTGMLAAVVSAALLLVRNAQIGKEVGAALATMPSAALLVAAAVLCTLAGMLIEPFANFTNRYALNRLFGWISVSEDMRPDDVLVRDHVVTQHLGALSGKLGNPYQLCKDYVEYKQLGPTVMIFLSRYGFYRSCAFILLVAGAVAAATATSCLEAIIILAIDFVLVAVLKRRGDEFYSYMAPAVYRAFLIERMVGAASPTSSGSGDSDDSAR